MVDGERMHVEIHSPKGEPVGAVLLVHGFNSCAQEFGRLPALLAAAGHHVLAYDQRGFGKSEGEEGLTTEDRFDADLDAATRALQEESAMTHIGVVGHSFGAAMLLRRLGTDSPFSAAVLAHPVLDLLAAMPAWKRPIMRSLGRINGIRRRRGRPNMRVSRASDYGRLFVDGQRAQQSWDEARYISSHVNAAIYDLWKSMDPLAWAAAVQTPTMVVLGPNDALIPFRDSQRVARELPGQPPILEHRGGHSCFRDLDDEYLAHHVGMWLAEQVAAT